MASNGNDITLKVNVDTQDAKTAINSFDKSVQKAFNSSDSKVQKLGNSLNRVNQGLKKAVTEAERMENTKVPTSQYTELSKKLDSVGKQYAKAREQLSKWKATRVPTQEYIDAGNNIKYAREQIKQTQAELKNYKTTDLFQATEKDIARLEKKFAELTIEKEKFETAGADNLSNATYFKTLIDLQQVEESLRNARTEQQKLIDTDRQYVGGRQGYEDRVAWLNILNQSIETNETEMQRLINEDKAFATTNQDDYNRKAEAVQRLGEQYLNTAEAMARMKRSGLDSTTEAQMNPEAYNRVKDNITNLNNQGTQLQQNMSQVNTIVNSVSNSFKRALATVRSFFSTALRLAKNLVTSGLNRVKSTVNSIAGAFTKLKGTVNTTSKSHNTSIKSMITMLLKYVFGIRSIFLLYKKLRTTISTGLTEMGKQFSDVQADINDLKNSWSTFKSSLISAFQPIYSYVVPALVTLINYLTSAMNALANFFAILTGKSTYKKAIQQNNDYADSASNVADSTKDANEELADYDDLMVISKDATSGSGSGGSDSSAGWQWEEVPTTTNATIEAIKSAWQNSDWTSLGNIIRDKLISMMNGIPWDTIYQKASNFGKNLASFLNGLFADDEEGNNVFSSLGTTIAGSLNTALYFLNSFASTFEWDTFGENLASGLESFMSTFKWDLAVESFNNLANGILTTIESAINTLIEDNFFQTLGDNIAEAIGGVDTSGFGAKLGSIASGIANAVYILVSNKDTWSNLGTKISEGINSFLTSMNKKNATTGKSGWEAIGESISSGVSGIASALATAIKGISTDEIKTAFKDLINGIKWENMGWELGGLVSSIAEKLYELTADQNQWKELGSKIGSGIKAFFTSLSEVASNGKTGWQNIGGTIGNTIKGIVNAITEAINSMSESDWKSVGQGIADMIAGIDWKNVTFAFGNLLTAVKKAIGAILNGAEITKEDIGYAIKMTLAGASIVIGAITAISLASTVTKAVVTELAKQAVIKLIGGESLALGTVATGTAKVALVIAVAITSWQLGKYTYKSSTGDETDYGSASQQLKEVFEGAWSGDLAKGILLDWTGDKKITLDLSKVVLSLGEAVTDPVKWLADKIIGAIFGDKITDVTVDLSAYNLIFKFAKWLVKFVGDDDTDKSFVDRIKEKLFGTGTGAGHSFDTSGDIEIDATDKDVTVKTGEIQIEEKDNENKGKSWKERLGDWFKKSFGITDSTDSSSIDLDTTVTAGVGLRKDFKDSQGKAVSDVSDWLKSDYLGSGVTGSVSGFKNTTNKTISSWLSEKNQFGDGVTGIISAFKNTAGGTVSNWLSQKAQMGNGATASIKLSNRNSKNKELWKSVADFVKKKGKTDVTATVKLSTGGKWNSVESWVGAGGSVTTQVKLAAYDGWKSVQGWCINKPQLTAGQIGQANSYLDVWVNLNQGKNNLSSVKGAAFGGVIGDYSGNLAHWFASGGAIRNGVASWWNNVPKYAGGTANAHGTVFVAGEAGPEIMGHVNGRTEILNKSQLASTMYASIVSGMQAVLRNLKGFDVNFGMDFTPLLNGLTQIPIPVVVTGQILPATEAFITHFADQEARLDRIESLVERLVERAEMPTESSNNAPIMLQLDGRTVAEVVWDETEKRYKQTGRRYSFA